MTDRRRAPTEVLERLAEAVHRYEPQFYLDVRAEGVELHAALAAYRAAVAPLRTETEVVLDIGHHVRACVRLGQVMMTAEEKERLEDLANEHTAPRSNSGPSSADTEEVPSPRPPVSPAGADLIERAAWERHPIYERGKCIRTDHEATTTGDHRYCRECMNKPCRWWSGWRPSGPTGVAAAKESKDNAAAPEGAANDRECNCDQALHLERRIGDAVRAIRRSSTIPAGLLHELLGILEGEA